MLWSLTFFLDTSPSSVFPLFWYFTESSYNGWGVGGRCLLACFECFSSDNKINNQHREQGQETESQ